MKAMNYTNNFPTLLRGIVRSPMYALILIGAILSATLPQANAQSGPVVNTPQTEINEIVGVIDGDMYFTSKTGGSSTNYDLFKMDTAHQVTRLTTDMKAYSSINEYYFIKDEFIYYSKYLPNNRPALTRFNTATSSVDVYEPGLTYTRGWFEYNDKAYFIGQDSTSSTTIRHLWSIDDAGTLTQVTSWNSNASTMGYNYGSTPIVVNGKLYTSGYLDTYSCSNGTQTCATNLEFVVVDLATGNLTTSYDVTPNGSSSSGYKAGTDPYLMEKHGDYITFWSEDYMDPKLYLYNIITGDAPKAISDFNSHYMMMSYMSPTVIGTKVYFTDEYDGLFVYDDAGTDSVGIEVPGSSDMYSFDLMGETNGYLYFSAYTYANNTSSQKLYKLDPANDTFTALNSSVQNMWGFSYNYFSNYNYYYIELSDGLYVSRVESSDSIGVEPHYIDLNNDTIFLASDVNTGASDCNPYKYTLYNGYIYAYGNTGSKNEFFRFVNNYQAPTSNNAPVLSNDYMVVAEDQSIVLVDAATHVLFTDADGDALATFRVDSLPNYGTLSIDGTPLVVGQEYTAAQLDSIEYTPGADLNGFDRMIWNASDGQAYAASPARITFEITAVNDAPVVYDASVQATEDLDTHIPSQFTGAIFTDVDGDGMSIFKLISEPAHGVLTVQGNNLSAGDTISGALATLLIYTPDANYTGADAFQWNASDGQVFAAANATVTIDVTPANDAPSAVLLNGTAIDENLPAGSVVGIFSATDVDANDTHNFALIAGTGDDDNGRFVIVGDTLKTTQVLDHESASRLSILVQASDRSGATVVSSFQIDVNDVNDAPSTLVMANNTVDESATIGTIVSDVYAFDQDAVDDYTLTLVSGAGDTDNASFAISGKNLVTNTTFNYNTQQVYNIRLRATDDAGAWLEGAFSIGINDNNSLPTDISLSSATIQEDQPVGSFIGTLSATDADQVDTHTFALVSGTGDADNALFSINGDELLSAASFDFEDRSSYSVRISTTDGAGASFEKVFTITVTNLNDAPSAVALSSNTVAEDATVGTVVGTLSTTDVDVADTHTYSLVQGTGSTDNVAFVINGDQLVTNAAFDFETKASYSIRVRATDNANASVEQVFTVSVTDVNDAPTNVTVTVLNVNENTIIGSTIGFINATDVDAADSHTFTLVSGIGSTDNASFSILTNKLQVNDAFDFETKASYDLRIRATDNDGASVEKAFTVTINDVNEAPISITEQVVSLTENMPNGTVAASLATTDVDAGDAHSYALVSGSGDTDNALFAISGDDIVVNGNLNWEAQSSYSVRVATYDQGNLTVEKVVTITITDINDAPTGVTLVRSTTSGSTITYSPREFRSVFADEDAGDALVSVRIDALPQFGTLYLKKNPISAGDVLAVGDLADLQYEAASNFAGTDNFMWSPSDGTAFADASVMALVNVTLSRTAGNNTLRRPISMNNALGGVLLTQASATNNRLAGEQNTTAIDEVAFEMNMSTYPNPFSASTNIKFSLAADQQVEVQVYDLLGRNIKQLAKGEFAKGEHNIAWDANDMEQGKYIIQFVVKDLKGNVLETKTTTVVKL